MIPQAQERSSDAEQIKCTHIYTSTTHDRPIAQFQQMVLRIKTKLPEDLGLKDLLSPLLCLSFHPPRIYNASSQVLYAFLQNTVLSSSRGLCTHGFLCREHSSPGYVLLNLWTQRNLLQAPLRAPLTSSLCTMCSFHERRNMSSWFSTVSKQLIQFLTHSQCSICMCLMNFSQPWHQIKITCRKQRKSR